MSQYPQIIYYWRAWKAFLLTFTISRQLLPTFYHFTPTSTNFYFLPPTFTNFYHLLPNFTDFFTTFTNFYKLLPISLIFITFHKLLPTFYHLLPTFVNSHQIFIIFHQSKMVLFHFFHLLTYTSPIILLDATLQALILCLHLLFKYFTLCRSIMASHQSDMNNSFRIIFIKIIILKNNIIKIYSIKAHIITKKFSKIIICISKRLYHH